MKTAEEIFNEVIERHYYHPEYQWEFEKDVVIDCMVTYAKQFQKQDNANAGCDLNSPRWRNRE